MQHCQAGIASYWGDRLTACSSRCGGRSGNLLVTASSLPISKGWKLRADRVFGTTPLVTVISFLGIDSHTELHLEAAPYRSVTETIHLESWWEDGTTHPRTASSVLHSNRPYEVQKGTHKYKAQVAICVTSVWCRVKISTNKAIEHAISGDLNNGCMLA